MTRFTAALMIAALAATGCSDKDGLFQRLGNPPPIHDDQVLPLKTNQVPAQQTPVINNIPVDAYLNAMRDAYNDPYNSASIDTYVNTGIALSDAYCTRWFARLDESQRRLSLAGKNFNVVRQLGTALIGVAKLSSDVTTVYGAANTALEGINNNVNEALFLAPDPAVIKQRLLQAMAARTAQLKGAQKPASFVEAYVQLERYADMCTFVAARQYVNQVIAAPAGKVGADTKTGEIILLDRRVTNFQTQHVQEVERLQDLADALSDTDAIALAARPPVRLAPDSPLARFGANLDKTTPQGARAYVKRLLTLTSGNVEDLAKWQAALAQ